MPNTDVLIVAAGDGARFGADGPKQYQLLLGRPMMVWPAERFASHPVIASITMVVAAGEEDRVGRMLADAGLTRVGRIVAGGPTRQQSVALGLWALGDSSEKVLVHDAARPCLSDDLISRILGALEENSAVVPAVPSVDTLIHEHNGTVDTIVDRIQVRAVQTPQGFDTGLLVRAHRQAESRGFESSDDASLVYALQETVRVVPGERTNIKVTLPEDLQIAEAILRSRQEG